MMSTRITDRPLFLLSSLPPTRLEPPPNHIILYIICTTMLITVDMMPTKMMLVMSRRVSRLRICVSSWPSTPASSSSESSWSSPLVTVTVYDFLSMPLAKAFSCGSSTMLIFGMSMPAVIQRFSTMLYTLGFSRLSSGRAPVAARTMPALKQ